MYLWGLGKRNPKASVISKDQNQSAHQKETDQPCFCLIWRLSMRLEKLVIPLLSQVWSSLHCMHNSNCSHFSCIFVLFQNTFHRALYWRVRGQTLTDVTNRQTFGKSHPSKIGITRKMSKTFVCICNIIVWPYHMKACLVSYANMEKSDEPANPRCLICIHSLRSRRKL